MFRGPRRASETVGIAYHECPLETGLMLYRFAHGRQKALRQTQRGAVLGDLSNDGGSTGLLFRAGGD